MKKWEESFEKYTKTGVVPAEVLPSQKKRINRLNEIDRRLIDIKVELLRAEPKKQKRLNEEERRLLKEKFKLNEQNEANKEEEMAEVINKCEKLIANYEKIGRIKSYRDKLQNDINEIKDELNRRNGINKSYKEIENNKKEIDNKTRVIMEANKALKELERRLQNKDLKPDEKSKIESEISKLTAERAKAQIDLGKAQEKTPKLEKEYEKINAQDGKLASVSREELESRKSQIQNKICKCNFYCNNLSKGKDLDEIELSLNNWDGKNYKDMEKELEKLRKGMNVIENVAGKDFEKSDTVEEGKTPTVFETSEYNANNEAIEETNKKIEKLKDKLNKSMIPQSEFDKKHPRLSAFLKTFSSKDRNAKKEIKKIENQIAEEEKKLEEKMKNKEIYENEYGVPGEKEKLEEERKKQQEIKERYERGSKELNEHNDFIEYIRKIAEKGPEEVEREEKEAKMRAARERYKNAREQAYKNESAKFGNNYSEQSKKMNSRANEGKEKDEGR